MPPVEPPYCLCIAGPNGSGKSTLVRALRRIAQLRDWIDPDVVASDLRGRPENIPYSDEHLSRIAFRQARYMRVEYARAGQSFGFETVYSHPSNLDFLRTLTAFGYKVDLYFVCTESPEINMQRVANRAASGGHDVPLDRIRTRWSKSIEVLLASLPFIERIALFDNSSEQADARFDAEIKLDGAQRTIKLNHSQEPLSDWAYSLVIRQFSLQAIQPAPEFTDSGLYKYVSNKLPKDLHTRRDAILNRFLI
ncbi:AAA family ATPase [Tardiphaga sp. 768_D3_N2_1]|uniref:AAA family ATPase n=1 Tax=Tardiphaga sp. 768_D3_N2_1 TaxID=3240783 RepID=UPI003F8BB079